ncbi:MAG: hypothetical protein ACRC7C_19935, partial [Beijerinckiaceae bacterium]
GSAAKNNDTIIKSFLQESHEYVFGELEPPAQRRRAIITLQAGSHLYDWHDDELDEDINPGRGMSVWVKVGANLSDPLHMGITESDRSYDTLREQPRKYDTLDGQLEVWPVPDRTYPMIVEYTAERGRFERASDRPSVPDRLVFLYALATAKAHYGRPDATAAATAFQNMLTREKSRQRGNRRYFAGDGNERSGDAAHVVRAANGYSLER